MSLRSTLGDYLTLRRGLGYKLRDTEDRLRKFVTFMENESASVITTEIAVRWSQRQTDVSPAHWATNLRTVRLFAEYYSGIDPRTEIPPQGILPYRTQRGKPYIYTPGQVTELLRAANLLRPHGGMMPRNYHVLFGLLATTGLRIGEALGLHRDALDLKRKLLTVRNTKFNKTRLVPLHGSTMAVLERYARKRDALHPAPRSPWFFVAQRGGPLYSWPVRMTFIRLSKQVGLRGVTDHHGPRLHDFRHTFAVQTLLNWYRAGEDVERKLPLLHGGRSEWPDKE